MYCAYIHVSFAPTHSSHPNHLSIHRSHQVISIQQQSLPARSKRSTPATSRVVEACGEGDGDGEMEREGDRETPYA